MYMHSFYYFCVSHFKNIFHYFDIVSLNQPNYDVVILLLMKCSIYTENKTKEPLHGKTNNLHRGKQRRRSASQ